MNIARHILSFLLDIVETVVVAASIFVIVYLFLVQPHQVIGDSMLPNFHNKEYILTDKISYRFKQPQRGDIVVFQSPEDKEKDFIKRLIAMPGETIEVSEGKVYIDAKLLPEEYLDPDLQTPNGRFLTEGQIFVVPPGSYMVFGDNRLNSSDSRSFGSIPAADIVGKALLVYWPPNNFRLVPGVENR